jgi:hypothetical protein
MNIILKIICTTIILQGIGTYVYADEDNSFVVSDLCQYKSEFEQCLEANKD